MKPATPLPWALSEQRIHYAIASYKTQQRVAEIRHCEGPNGHNTKDNAAYIVAACNAYPALVAALRESLQAYEGDFGPMHISTRHRALLRSLGEEA